METRLILGESIPRSGHHFLVRLLRKYFKKDLYYCEPYQRDCCNVFPCQKSGEAWYVFKKSHDLQLSDDPDRKDTYIIQYREPVFCVLSQAELRRKHNENFAKTREELEFYLAERAAFFVLFMVKWHHPGKRNYILIDYDRLTKNTIETIEQILNVLRYRRKKMSIEALVEELRTLRPDKTAYQERTVENSLFYDKELLELHESIVLGRLRYLEEKRRMTKIENYRESAMFFGFVGHRRTFEGDLLGASQAFMRAFQINGSKQYYTASKSRLGDHHWNADRTDEARKCYRDAMQYGVHSAYVEKRAERAN